MIDVNLLCQSTAEHLTQIFTGFSLLARHNLIKLRIQRDKDYQAGYAGKPLIRAILNHKARLVFDTYDGNKLFEEDLDWCDIYFKRSFDKNEIGKKLLTTKVFPLGFNYSVYADTDNQSIQKLIWNLGRGFSIDNLSPYIRSNLILSYFLKTSSGKFTSRVSRFEKFPEIVRNPLILFTARLWEPAGRKDEPDRIEINKMRADCIRLLKNCFGSQFVGGLYPSPEAITRYPDIVLKMRDVKKYNYMKYLHNSQICVATRGLLGSNGWKIAEYIAGAKAIVSESLMYQVPGNFLPEQNYLEFVSPQECIEKVQFLVDDSELRYKLMHNNFEYYHAYLRPDILIWNALQLALLQRLNINNNNVL